MGWGLRESERDSCSPHMTRILEPMWPEMAIIRLHSRESHDIILTLNCSLRTVADVSIHTLESCYLCFKSQSSSYPDFYGTKKLAGDLIFKSQVLLQEYLCYYYPNPHAQK